jgi:hypothetical protein
MKLLRLLLLLACASPVWAADQEAETTRFVQNVFNPAPVPEFLWLDGEMRKRVQAILEHDYPAARLRYWRMGNRTAWVLEEIGKEMPITVGISVQEDAVERVRVLVYRESRGWEVKSPAFTRQFDGARLAGEQRLDRSIDGISGATLSVRALTRLTRLALLLHRHVLAGAVRP